MTKNFQRKKWIFATIFAVIALILGFRFLGPWEKLMVMWNNTPVPYHFVSLRNCSDEEIDRFMSGAMRVDSFHEEGAPDSNFPESLWKTDPKKAALAFAEANRSSTHRKNFNLWVDSNPSLAAPDIGWLVFDDYSDLTVLRFGIDQPFVLHAAIRSHGMASNRYVDGEKHALQFIPLSPEEARFLAHTLFWLEHLKSMPRKKDIMKSSISSSHESYGTLEWEIENQARGQIQGALWSWHAIADGWRGDCDEQAQVNLSHYLLSEALPKYLGKRWEQPTRFNYDSYKLPLAERIKSRDDPAAQAKLTQITLAALARHETEPLPAKALVALARCAGDAGLAATLPALESLVAKLPPSTADEIEYTTLDAQFRFTYHEPTDPDERKKWDRHQSLKPALEHDFLTQVRRPLIQAIHQLHVLGQPARLRELAKSKDDAAMWALRQLYQLQPDAYAEALVHRFTIDDSRRLIFEILSTLHPSATRRLRDSLTDKEQAELFFEIAEFELSDDPTRAQARIPKLLEIVEKPTEKILINGFQAPSQRGPAIALLAKLPLNAADQKRFEALLVNELLLPETLEIFGKCAISEAAKAIMVQSDPDRFWDALYAAASVENGSSEFRSLFDALATLALTKPELRLSSLAELLRLRFHNHIGQIENLFSTALALDLRSLAPEMGYSATSDPLAPDGEVTNSCKNDPDHPCLHRYHSARHVSALWQEPDADTLARMWTALLMNSPYDFSGTDPIPSCLRDRCRSAILAASPEIYKRLIAKTRATNDLPREILNWLAGFP